MVIWIRPCVGISRVCVLPLYIYFVVDMAGVDDVIHVTSGRRSRGIQSKVGKRADRSLSGWSAASGRSVVLGLYSNKCACSTSSSLQLCDYAVGTSFNAWSVTLWAHRFCWAYRLQVWWSGHICYCANPHSFIQSSLLHATNRRLWEDDVDACFSPSSLSASRSAEWHRVSRTRVQPQNYSTALGRPLSIHVVNRKQCH